MAKHTMTRTRINAMPLALISQLRHHQRLNLQANRPPKHYVGLSVAGITMLVDGTHPRVDPR